MIKRKGEIKMMILKLMTTITILATFLVSPLGGLGQSSASLDADQNGISSEKQTEESEGPSAEMRASIVDKEGDQFIAMTEEGQEFRLPVEGAPENVNVGDELRLVPDSDSHTIQVFKAEPLETGISGKLDSQL
jgi:hypothetical protein